MPTDAAKSHTYTAMEVNILPAGTHEVTLRGGTKIVVNARGEVAVHGSDCGWVWALPVTLNEMAPALMPVHAPDDGRQP